MAQVSHHDVTIRLVLDENRPYFPGDSIRGKVMLACPRPISPHGIRLIWAGGVTIRPTPQDQENHLYFKRNYAISNNKLDGKKVSNGMAYKSSAFVENHDTSIPLLFTMQQAVTYSFAFDVQVPVDIPLPSSTEAETSMLGGKIVYTIECCLDLMMDDPAPVRSHIMVTVLEHLDVRSPELAVPRTEESVYALWLAGTPKTSPCNYKTAMRVTLPYQASTRGGQVNIVIHVWHSVEYQRPKGVTVSLIRVRQLHYLGSAYAFPDETILLMRADVDLKQDKKFVQTLHCTLPIREDLTPSISDNAKLLEIFYKVQIKVQLQEGSYQTMAGDIQNFMSVEVPLVIGTVPLMIGKKMVSPRKNLAIKSPPTRTITNGSKKSDGSKDNDGASVMSNETNKKQGSGLFGRKASKHEPAVEKKNGSLRKIFNWSSSKSKLKDDSATVVSSSNSNNGNNKYDDDEPIQNHSGISSSKNTDYDQHNSFYNGSQTSQSVSSPRTEMDSLTAQMQELAKNNNNKSNQPFKITNSSVELKPDEKDDEIFDFELLAAINKSKAEAEATSLASPTISAFMNHQDDGHIGTFGVDSSKAPITTSASLNTTTTTATNDMNSGKDKRQSGSIRDDDIFDNGTDGRPQSPMSVPTTVTSNNDAPGRARAIRYHNIFESSDEGEEEEEDDNAFEQHSTHEQQTLNDTTEDDSTRKGITYHSPFMDSDDEDENDGDSDGDENDNIQANNTTNTNDEMGDGRIIKPTENDPSIESSTSYFQQQHHLPSPPPDRLSQHYTNYKGDSNSSSDESDDSPLNLMSKRNRQRYQQQH
ncbi:hypothetical protein BC941DRAFT_415161 [Chlamydoabsidia padenii]|nr:hypothetical protein BC941DRAFT_415161 [Chlamydoabsidia padenii]